MLFWLLLSCLSLNASNITVTNSLTYYDHQETESWYTDSTNIVYVPNFNPAIGTLIKAEVYVKMTVTNNFFAENRSQLSRGEDFINFIGVIGVTNQSSFSFAGQTQYLSRTNFLALDVYDGLTDYAGTSGGRATNIVSEVFVLQPPLEDVIGYKVWAATNSNSARAAMYFYTGAFAGGVRTVAGLDTWVVYTYINTFDCPDCVPCKPKCDDGRDKCDKDKDEDCKDKDKKPKNPKDKDCDDDKDRDKKNGRR